MDYNKTIVIGDFLTHKSHSMGEIFNIKIEINNYANQWLSFDSDFIVENAIGGSDYKLTFMNDLLKHYLENVQMGANFLTDIRFDNGYLHFTTSNGKKVRLS